jgi:Fe-Mn family superoxide dismutase
MEQQNLKGIFANISQLDAAVRNNGGGYFNHLLYWQNMSYDKAEIPESLKPELTTKFGSVDIFKAKLKKAALSVFGNGLVWLILNSDGKLAIVTSRNQDNPLMDVANAKGTPLLVLDAWEHAYYLKYQNKRSAYVEAFWNVIN